MKFVKTEELTAGMRLAKPIYNRNGVLLYDRNSKLTVPGINSVRNFGLIGVYILEPAEPLPPLTREDLEFEQSQTVYMFQLREQLDLLAKHQKMTGLNALVNDIIKRYSSLDHRINFNQNLRNSEDFMYKHSISTAILTAMLTSRLGYSQEKQMTMIAAALLYDFGYQFVPKPILAKGTLLTASDRDTIQKCLERGLEFLSAFASEEIFYQKAVGLIVAYVYSNNPQKALTPNDEMLEMMRILRVADMFDQLTAMNLGHEPESEIMAMQKLSGDRETFDPHIVRVLAECIHIVPQAANVDLSDGGKGIVLVENPSDFMHPIILRLADNQIYDLSDPKQADSISIIDIMKTMDNRIAVDEDTIRQFVPDERLIEMTQEMQKKLTLANLRADTKPTSFLDKYL